MKNILLILFVATCNLSMAQDIFQQKLYSPELVLKYREEAGLSADQVEKIKKIYNTELPAYNNKKWDLDAVMVKLEQIISQSNVDVNAANAQLEKSLALEADIKKMKLSMLLKIKNTLTAAQQTKLDAHKDESISESSVIALRDQTQNMVVRLRGSAEPSLKPMYIIVNGDEKKIVTEVPAGLPGEDIESVEVLKGSSATAIYGKQGENGVVILTLKKKK